MNTHPATQTTVSPSTDTRDSDTTGVLLVDCGRASDTTKGSPFGFYYEATQNGFSQSLYPV